MKKILLVVGDINLSIKLAQLCLSAEISEIDEISSCAAALERVEENHYDLIVCDDFLADGSTDAVICKIRISNPNCPILAFSNDYVARSCMWERGCESVVAPNAVEASLKKMLASLN
ncbi:MAG: response regulator [Patescibacteria group bacterium]